MRNGRASRRNRDFQSVLDARADFRDKDFNPMEVSNLKAIKNSDDDENYGNSRRSTKNKPGKKQESEEEEESEEEDNIYESLTSYADGHSQYGYDYKERKKNGKSRFYLPGDFSLPASLYNNLFEH